MVTKIINQTQHNTCAACVMAMMVGESEQYVLDWFKHIDPPFCDENVFIFLAHHGIFLAIGANLKINDKGIDLSDYLSVEVNIKLDKHRAYMIVDSPTRSDLTHAVFWDKKNILDPLKKTPQKLSNYRVRQIYPMMETEIRQLTKNRLFIEVKKD